MSIVNPFQYAHVAFDVCGGRGIWTRISVQEHVSHNPKSKLDPTIRIPSASWIWG